MVCHETYQDPSGKWLYPHEVTHEKGLVYHKHPDHPVTVGASVKMSKSKKNTIDPMFILNTYGADVARLFVLSDTPCDKDFDWNNDGLEGCWRYANKLWRLMDWGKTFTQGVPCSDALARLTQKRHAYVQKITEAYQSNAFNKAIAFHREFVRCVEEEGDYVTTESVHDSLEVVFKLILPIMPHLGSEALETLSIQDFSWPDFDPQKAQEQSVSYALQCNGKLKSLMTCAVDASKEEVIQKAQNHLQNFLHDKDVVKIIFVPQKIVNFVIKGA